MKTTHTYALLWMMVASATAFFPHHRIATTAPNATRIQYKRDFGAQTFQQLVNHDSPNSATFSQRYWVNDMFWTGTGPIFLYVGGEVSMQTSDVTATQFVRYAQASNALLVALEHRYFGLSQPNLDLTDLTFLTVPQAMADAANFITSFKTSKNAPNVPVYTIGSSYGANVASWLRIKYPNIFAGSLASSAPVQLVRDFSAYVVEVKASIDSITGSTTCTSNLATAFAAFETAINDPSRLSEITSQFTLCYPLLNTETDRGVLLANMMEIWMTAVQYNYASTINNYCTILASPDTPLNNLARVSNTELSADGRGCMNSAYDSLIAYYKTPVIDPNAYVGYRQYFYLQCTQLGFFMTNSAPASQQPFGNGVALSLYVQECQDTFPGITQSDAAVNQFNAAFGGKNPSSVGATNIVYTNGALDPWAALSVTSPQGSTLNAYIVSGQGHSADIWPAYGNSALQTVQSQVSSSLASFVSNYKAPAATSSTTSSTVSPTPTTSSVSPATPTPSTTSQGQPAVPATSSTTSQGQPAVPATSSTTSQGQAGVATSTNSPAATTSQGQAGTPSTGNTGVATPATSTSQGQAAPATTTNQAQADPSTTGQQEVDATVTEAATPTFNRAQTGSAIKMTSSFILGASLVVLCIIFQ